MYASYPSSRTIDHQAFQEGTQHKHARTSKSSTYGGAPDGEMSRLPPKPTMWTSHRLKRNAPPSAPTPAWLPRTASPGIPELLTRVDAMTDRQDLILARVNGPRRRMVVLDTRISAPTLGLADDRIHMLETELEFQWEVGTFTREIEALRVKIQGTTDTEVVYSTRPQVADLLDHSRAVLYNLAAPRDNCNGPSGCAGPNFDEKLFLGDHQTPVQAVCISTGADLESSS
ncbi:hypothetical protein EDD15DRAFT_2204533 [Pisolithus albus]|nr:hypothetical protein EDD15DRAFT_2204533 [Pisolithus albus]